ncbi:sorting nexin-14-like isoform X2 [Saccostrea echinata]|uniref:sorting nexin-14-like isoform X2 n=1 Tax=Saccostrea echinata TaxID=191078 RepID=UPI002A81E7B0|nr:sorting nexin-14-like isoform X2 [Saccostrea echinata]
MIPWYIIKHYLQKHSRFCTSTVILLLFTFIFHRYFSLILIIWSFIFGLAVTYSCISSDTILPSLLFLYQRKKKPDDEDDELTLMKTVCTVCGQRRCPRHRPELNILAFQPWTYLKVRHKVDESIEEFANIVLKEFLYTWYRDLSTDEGFPDELKTSIRFLASVLLRRLKKVDIPKLVSEKLIKAALQHLHVYLEARKHAPLGGDLQQLTLEQLGPNMHVAMLSRKCELEYLRRLVESLFPYILPPQAVKSKCTCGLIREILAGSVLLPALDAVANPDMVNNLILIFLDKTPPPAATEPPSPYVPFLENFAKPLTKNKSCLRVELKDILFRNSPKHLYPFMQFLKNEGAINVLQFSLACEDFNTRILSPELSQGDLVELHNMAKDLYRSYCAKDAVDRIKFDETIVSELAEVVEGPPDQVVKLRTSTPLFKAYDHTYDLLENTFLPLFHQSDDYYTMLCGSREPTQIMRAMPNVLPLSRPVLYNNRPVERRGFGLSNIGTKIKGVFKSGEMKSLPETGLDFEDADKVTISSCNSLDDEISDSAVGVDELPDFTEMTIPDLSTWRVSIPRIGARPDPDNFKKQFFVFIIDVRRVDLSDENLGDRSKKANWTVARRYNEFYVLENKLAEFHEGLLQECKLPPKKVIGTSKHEFIESKREQFEAYLQKLLTKPYLTGSQLLYNFLSTDDEFSAGFLSDIKLGKMFKSGAMKLVKERGQHLDMYLNSFEQSTIAPPPKPSKPERRGSDTSLKSTSSEKLCAGLYENNANYSNDSICSNLSRSSDGQEWYPMATSDMDSYRGQEIEGPFDVIVYISRYVYGVPDWFHHLLMTGRILFKSTLEHYLQLFIEQKVEQVTQEHRVVSLVHLLRDVLFFDKDPPRTDEQKSERYRTCLQGCLDFLPSNFVSVVGRRNHEQGTKLLLEVLQQPKLNKQLSYVFLDILVQELFPELRG